jgi:hypothetical protein
MPTHLAGALGFGKTTEPAAQQKQIWDCPHSVHEAGTPTSERHQKKLCAQEKLLLL